MHVIVCVCLCVYQHGCVHTWLLNLSTHGSLRPIGVRCLYLSSPLSFDTGSLAEPESHGFNWTGWAVNLRGGMPYLLQEYAAIFEVQIVSVIRLGKLGSF